LDLLAKLEGNGMKDKKIKELASKYKTLNIAYEKEKTMYFHFKLGENNWKTNLPQTFKQIRKKKNAKTQRKRKKVRLRFKSQNAWDANRAIKK
jgi:hypothetical protein